MAGISAVAAFPTAVVSFNVFVGVPADVGFPAVAGFPNVAVALLCCSIEKLNIVDYRTFRLRLSDWKIFLLSDYQNIYYLAKLSDYRLSKPGKN